MVRRCMFILIQRRQHLAIVFSSFRLIGFHFYYMTGWNLSIKVDESILFSHVKSSYIMYIMQYPSPDRLKTNDKNSETGG